MDAETLIGRAQDACRGEFGAIDAVALFNQKKVLDAFAAHRVAERHFAPTTGYGYDDVGRDTLGAIYADVFGAEAAIVSPLWSGGTHTISDCLFGLLRTGDKLLAATGDPYDTLMPVIRGKGIGSLAEYGIGYEKIDLVDGAIDFGALKTALADPAVKVVLMQRSKGYEWRDALSCAALGEAAVFAHGLRPDIAVFVDNCYGEFTERAEPTELGVDLVAGSLIKNPGGGLAPTGGYIAGKRACVDCVAARLTAPGIGTEVGSYAGGYRLFYQGLFFAPHVVAQALKGSALAARVFSSLGYETQPAAGEPMYDIIRSIRFPSERELISFCRSVQAVSPVDAFVTPEPWDMPGYAHKVIMAAGTFVGGASIELSCDSPIKEPYIAYLQGGLTYEHVRLALTRIVEDLIAAGAVRP